MQTKREKLIKDIADVLKEKALSQYRYGGYTFYPDGTVEKRSARVTNTQQGLRIHSAVSTQASETDRVYDPYLLTDLLDTLKGESPTTEKSFRQMFAEDAIKEEEEERISWEVGNDLLKERSTILKYFRGIENFSIHIEPTDDFDTYMSGVGAWCDMQSTPEAKEKLYKFLKKVRSHIKPKKAKREVCLEEQ